MQEPAAGPPQLASTTSPEATTASEPDATAASEDVGRDQLRQVRAYLIEARRSFDAGQLDRARESVDLALAIDPAYLAAHALRERIAAGRKPQGEFSAPSAIDGSLATLEDRARKRRIARRIQAARTSLHAGALEEARAAVAELAELDPDGEESIAVREELARAARSLFAPVSSTGRWVVPTIVGCAAAVVIALLLTGSTIHSRRSNSVRQAPATLLVSTRSFGDVAFLIDPPDPFDVPVESGTPPRLPLVSAPEPVSEAARAPTQPQAVAATPLLPPAVATAPVLPPAISTTDVLPAIGRATAPIVPAVSRPEAVSVAPVPGDDQLIRAALQRYRSAYDDLDAQSAQAVWPQVDAVALERAFAGLESQHLTFRDCSVDVFGVLATATCSGSATYTPRIGSREPRVEARVWNFTLRKVDARWQIDAARVGR